MPKLGKEGEPLKIFCTFNRPSFREVPFSKPARHDCKEKVTAPHSHLTTHCCIRACSSHPNPRDFSPLQVVGRLFTIRTPLTLLFMQVHLQVFSHFVRIRRLLANKLHPQRPVYRFRPLADKRSSCCFYELPIVE